jgi:hypothetical protein
MFIPNSFWLRFVTIGNSIFGFLIGTLLLHDGVKGILPLILLQVGRGFFNALTGFKDIPIGKNKKLITLLSLVFLVLVVMLSKSILLSCLFLVGMSNGLLLNRSVFISGGSPVPLGILLVSNSLTYLGLYILDSSFDNVLIFAQGISASIALLVYIWSQSNESIVKAFSSTKHLKIEPVILAIIFGLTNALLIIFFNKIDQLYYVERGLLLFNNVYVVPYLYRRHVSFEVVVIRVSLILLAISSGIMSIWFEELSLVGAIILFPYLSKLFRVYQVESITAKFSYIALFPSVAFFFLFSEIPHLGYFIFWLLTLYFLAHRCVGHYRISF